MVAECVDAETPLGRTITSLADVGVGLEEAFHLVEGE